MGTLALTATMPPSGYVGIVFWFGPCVDMSAYTGIQFNVGGTMTAFAEFQVQTNSDYPVDQANARGACVSRCTNPAANLAIPAAASLVQMPFASLSGGTPVDDVTTTEILGLQFQFVCESEGRAQGIAHKRFSAADIIGAGSGCCVQGEPQLCLAFHAVRLSARSG